MPQGVFSRGVIGHSEKIDHIATHYVYDDGKAIVAEGGWLMADGFGFEMSFNLVLEKATLCYDSTRDPMFRLCPAQGEPFTPEVPSGDGYAGEIDYFLKKLTGVSLPPITTVENSRESVRIVLAETESVRTGNLVKLD